MTQFNRYRANPERVPENRRLREVLLALLDLLMIPDRIDPNLPPEAIAGRILDYAKYQEDAAFARYPARHKHRETSPAGHVGEPPRNPVGEVDRLSALLNGQSVQLSDEELRLLRETCVTGYALLPLHISDL
jgi:hypothetical protein